MRIQTGPKLVAWTSGNIYEAETEVAYASEYILYLLRDGFTHSKCLSHALRRHYLCPSLSFGRLDSMIVLLPIAFSVTGP